MTEVFGGIELLTDPSLPEDCVKFIHGDGRVDVFRIEGGQATRMVVNPIGKIFDPDSVAGRFWTASRHKRERREEIEAMPKLSERGHATMVDVWQHRSLVEALIADDPVFRWVLGSDPAPDALDVWLSEDAPIPEVEAAFA